MLWKQPYETKILRDLVCPVASIISLNGNPIVHSRQVWIAGFGFSATTDQGVWSRLFQSDFPQDDAIYKVFILDRKIEHGDFDIASSLYPPSQRAQCQLVEDNNNAWFNLVNPDSSERGFAAILEDDGRIPLLMIGPPTEDAWEEFSSCWHSRI
jgi:hypothetical protein